MVHYFTTLLRWNYRNPDESTIERAEVLEAYNPIFDVPNTGTLGGD